MSPWRLFAIALILTVPSVSFAFDLITSKEVVRATAATDGLLYCLSKGHEVFQVETPLDPHVEARELVVKPEAVERVERRDILLVDGLIPVRGDTRTTHGRRLYVRSVGWVDHLVCIKGVPI